VTRSSPRIEQFDVVAFDADDTLWKSEDSFQDAEARFAELVDPYAPVGIDVLDALHAVERLDIASQGYGVKAFTLSMVRAAIDMTEDAVPSAVIRELVEIGARMLIEPVLRPRRRTRTAGPDHEGRPRPSDAQGHNVRAGAPLHRH